MNRICLVGRVTKDLELKKTPSALSVVNFSIAVNKFSKDPENNVDFFDCVVYGTQADNLVKYQSKGSLIAVEGKLDTRTYQTKDGQNRKIYEVICDKITFIGSRSSEVQERPINQPNQTIKEVSRETKEEVNEELSTVNDLPF